MNAEQILVGITMGSDSDLPIMQAAIDVLEELGIAHEVRIVSAHRTPDVMAEYGTSASDRGLKVIIAGAGGAAHLPGMLAAYTTLPVIGVPVPIGNLQGLDALLSIAQMPGGVPVATMAIGNAKNAGLLAARIIGAFDADVGRAMAEYQREMAQAVAIKDEKVSRKYAGNATGFGFTG